MSLSRGRIFGIYVHPDSTKLHLGKSGDVRLAAEGEKNVINLDNSEDLFCKFRYPV